MPNGDVLEYLVDGLGRRVGKKINGVLEKQWLWRSQLQPVAELDGLGNVAKRFVYAGGVNVPDLVVTQTATYRLIKDHLGSVRTVVDIATVAIVQALEYDSWGRVLMDDNPGAQPFRFAGGLYDADTGLLRFGARDYDAETGWWTSKDPVRFTAGSNFYEYVSSDPVHLTDATGLLEVAIGAVGFETSGFFGGLAAVGAVGYINYRVWGEVGEQYDALERELNPEWDVPTVAPCPTSAVDGAQPLIPERPTSPCELNGEGFPYPDGGSNCRCVCASGHTCTVHELDGCQSMKACSCTFN